MSLWSWLKSVFGPKSVTRDISGLADATDADQVDEIVDLRGGPLKPLHLRLALRDRRLLPKPRSWILPRGRRKKLFTKAEAARLFGATLRTRRRDLRDLLPDDAQLERYGLPLWRNEQELATALGLSLGELRFFSIHRQRERVSHYVTFAIPKRSGGERLIMAPKRRLKQVQRRLNDLLVSRLPVSPLAHGFVKGRSIKSNAEPHVGKKVLLQLDLADFFTTITFARVRGLLIALGYGYPVATTLAVLMTEAQRQPIEADGSLFFVPLGPRALVQGAPTSPGLANAIALRLDRRLAGLAKKYGYEYTRYADDLCFSSQDPSRVRGLLEAAKRVIEAEGFSVNEKKTRISRSGRHQRVAGVTVNRVLGLSRKERRRLRACLHQAAKAGAPVAAQRALEGCLAYVWMLNPAQAEALRRARPPSVGP